MISDSGEETPEHDSRPMGLIAFQYAAFITGDVAVLWCPFLPTPCSLHQEHTFSQ